MNETQLRRLSFRYGSRAAKLSASIMSPLTPPTADIDADLDLRRCGPGPDVRRSPDADGTLVVAPNDHSQTPRANSKKYISYSALPAED
jgi:hypothetical protein